MLIGWWKCVQRPKELNAVFLQRKDSPEFTGVFAMTSQNIIVANNEDRLWLYVCVYMCILCIYINILKFYSIEIYRKMQILIYLYACLHIYTYMHVYGIINMFKKFYLKKKLTKLWNFYNIQCYRNFKNEGSPEVLITEVSVLWQ